MLRTPDFESEDSHANRVRAEGWESIRNRAENLRIPELDVRRYYDRVTAYPKEVTPGVLQEIVLQDVLSKDWQSFPDLGIERSSYGYADNLEQLQELFQFLDDSKRVFCVSVYEGEVNRDKPWKDGYHILTHTCDEYGGKVLVHYQVWEKVK